MRVYFDSTQFTHFLFIYIHNITWFGHVVRYISWILLDNTDAPAKRVHGCAGCMVGPGIAIKVLAMSTFKWCSDSRSAPLFSQFSMDRPNRERKLEISSRRLTLTLVVWSDSDSGGRIPRLGWLWFGCTIILPSCPASSAKLPLAQAELGRWWNINILCSTQPSMRPAT